MGYFANTILITTYFCNILLIDFASLLQARNIIVAATGYTLLVHTTAFIHDIYVDLCCKDTVL